MLDIVTISVHKDLVLLEIRYRRNVAIFFKERMNVSRKGSRIATIYSDVAAMTGRIVGFQV